MAKFFRSLFGTRKVEQPEVPGEEELYIPQYIPRAPEEQEAYDIYGRRTRERAGATDITLGTLGQTMYKEMMRRLNEQAAPGFYARGMGGQAGAAGLGAFKAREAPGQYLKAFETEEDVTRKRLADIMPFLETGYREREFKYRPEESKAERSQLLAGYRYGQRLMQAQEEAQRLAERRKFWGELVKTGIVAATGGMGGGGARTAGAIQPGARAFQPSQYSLRG